MVSYKDLFLTADLENKDKLIEALDIGLNSVYEKAGKDPVYPGDDRLLQSEINEKCRIPQRGRDLTSLLTDVYKEFNGCIKTGHEFCFKNVLPHPNIAGLVGLMLGNLYMANGVTGEDAGGLLDCELKCAAAMSEFVGYDPKLSAGVFTYGGSGTNLYAIKVGLTKASPSSGVDGKINNTYVIGSRSAHYCHLAGVNWLGIGEKNYIQISVNSDQTTKLDLMKKEIESVLENGGKIAAIVLSGGTTSNMAIDDIKEIYDFRNEMVKKYRLDYSPHIHCDSVLGWAYCCFKDYDKNQNIFKFSKATLEQIDCLQKKTGQFKYADSLGIDFHKTGYVQYIASMILFKNKEDFNLIKKEKEKLTPLFHDERSYNPGIFTLETTRSTGQMLSVWLSLNSIGVEGFQKLLGNALDCANYLRELVDQEDNGMFIINKFYYGSDVFWGIKNFKDKDPILDFEDIKQLNSNTDKFAHYIMSGEKRYAVSKSSAAIYNSKQEAIHGIRVYSLSPFVNKVSIKSFYEMIKEDRWKYEKDVRMADKVIEFKDC